MAQIFFAENIKFIRSCLQETQQQMSDRLETSLKRYQSYEKDNVEPPYPLLLQFSVKLGVKVDPLLSEDMSQTYTESDILRSISRVK